MAEANLGWGAPRIHGELLKLGIDIGERSDGTQEEETRTDSQLGLHGSTSLACLT